MEIAVKLNLAMRLFPCVTALLLSACNAASPVPQFQPLPPPVAPQVQQAVSPLPPSAATKNDTLTFSVVASDPGNKPLTYQWSAYKGTLVGSLTASSIQWRPTQPDGSISPGLGNVAVVISDGLHTTTSTLTMRVHADGSAGQAVFEATQGPSATPTPQPSPTQASAKPSATPSATVSPSQAPSPSPTATPYSFFF
jgi:hypothetical protein